MSIIDYKEGLTFERARSLSRSLSRSRFVSAFLYCWC